ncbi:hypothetical protein COXBURSA331_A2089 [Coxiella burnetii RSA 331]|nr:hypothetical protein COXBURSA331_A2089 [Coxiella burnetii RSA 331]
MRSALKARWIPACAGMTVKKTNPNINLSILVHSTLTFASFQFLER